MPHWKVFISIGLALVILAGVACSNEAEAPTATAVKVQATHTPAPESTPTPEAPTAVKVQATHTPAPESTPIPEAISIAVKVQATHTPAPESTPTPEAISIAASFSIISDWIENVGGDRVEVFSIVPRQVDPHSYHPGTRHLAKVSEADLVFAIGLGFEESQLHEFIENAGRQKEDIVAIGDHIDPIPFDEQDAHGDEDEHEEQDAHGDEDEHEEHDAHGDEDRHDAHDHGALDPHFWFDPTRVKAAITAISQEIAALQPESADYFQANAEAYIGQLEELDGWIKSRVSELDEHDRMLVTTHDAFGYLAARYGFTVVGVIIPGGGTEADPSPSHLVDLLHEIEDHEVSAIFSEAQISSDLADTLAREAGVSVVGGLQPGTLGTEGSESDTYMRMMRYNVDIIVNALAD